MKIEIELPAIDGFEYTGEYRFPVTDEWYLSGYLKLLQAGFNSGYEEPRPILKPVEKWIPASLEYIQAYYKWGEAVEVRVRDNVNDAWTYQRLCRCDFWLTWEYAEIKEVKK